MSNKKVEIEVGDWVRFYYGGVLVVGVVEYIQESRIYTKQICTDKGIVDIDSVLEVRKQNND